MMTEAQLEARRRGGRARAKQFTSESQREARSNVKRTSSQAAGKKGYAALYAKDPQAASKVLANYRKNNPSSLVRRVINWLHLHEIPYKLEHNIEPWYADILVSSSLIVRVNGTIWHIEHSLHGRDVVSRDAAEQAHYEALGYTVLTLWEDDIISGASYYPLAKCIEESREEEF